MKNASAISYVEHWSVLPSVRKLIVADWTKWTTSNLFCMSSTQHSMKALIPLNRVLAPNNFNFCRNILPMLVDVHDHAARNNPISKPVKSGAIVAIQFSGEHGWDPIKRLVYIQIYRWNFDSSNIRTSTFSCPLGWHNLAWSCVNGYILSRFFQK